MSAVAQVSSRPLAASLAEVNQHADRLEILIGRILGRDDGGRPVRVLRSNDRDGLLRLSLQPSELTEDADGDRGRVATIKVADGTRKGMSLWASILEAWSPRPGKKGVKCDFVKVQLAFFLGLASEEGPVARHQVFRLEWEDRQANQEGSLPGVYSFPAPGSAHPHWHVDRWLTASSPLRQVELIRDLEKDDEVLEVQEFEEGMGAGRPEASAQPDLAWFTRLHLPLLAGWLDTPLQGADFVASGQIPHVRGPSSVPELGNWIESSLWYLDSEFRNYCR